uniref:Uncharacterized protein n=1 Tax=Glossina pallidipes TaxID=7398 RepID=A0A1B0AB86_GLOPL
METHPQLCDLIAFSVDNSYSFITESRFCLKKFSGVTNSAKLTTLFMSSSINCIVICCSRFCSSNKSESQSIATSCGASFPVSISKNVSNASSSSACLSRSTSSSSSINTRSRSDIISVDSSSSTTSGAAFWGSGCSSSSGWSIFSLTIVSPVVGSTKRPLSRVSSSNSSNSFDEYTVDSSGVPSSDISSKLVRDSFYKGLCGYANK